VCTTVANLGLQLAIYLKPVLPDLIATIERILLVGPLTWNDVGRQLERQTIGPFERLLERVDRKKLDAMVAAAQKEFESAASAPPQEPHEPLADSCTIESFAAIDLRVAQIVEAKEVQGAKKLLCCHLDLGPLGQRTVFAGIRESYPDPAVLVGKKVICVANLLPRKMKFGVSEGMICASAGPQGSGRVRVIMADADARPGDRVS
jgi:methionyl-tRNA synthetase